MNYTSLDEAYKIHHTNNNTYRGTLIYSTQCIYCKNAKSIALMVDGSFRKCEICKKNFKANILTNAVTNYSYSTDHLRSTN